MFKYIAVLFILSIPVYAQELSEVEREKRHIVSRLYQVTDRQLALCPDQDVAAFSDVLEQFYMKYPELNLLIKKPLNSSLAWV